MSFFASKLPLILEQCSNLYTSHKYFEHHFRFFAIAITAILGLEVLEVPTHLLTMKRNGKHPNENNLKALTTNSHIQNEVTVC